MIRLLFLLAFAAALGVNAGSAQNLLSNPDAEETIVGGQIPGWTIVSGNWRYRSSDPQEFEGDNYFFGGPGSGTAIGETTELQQDVDVSAYAAAIDAGQQPFTFAGYIRALVDEARVVVEYQSVSGSVLASYDSGLFTEDTHWELLRDVRTAPPGTRLIRVRLLATYLEPTNNSGYFDAFTLVADDGAPASTFDAGDEAWRVEGDPVAGTFVWGATGGNPGGHIRVSDLNTGIRIWWVAPPAFLGDQSGRYGGEIRFDRVTDRTDKRNPPDYDVSLRGNDGVLLTYAMPDDSEPGLTWTSGAVPLTEAGWENDGTGQPATQAEFQAVLADLERVDILAEYTNAQETNGIDNVAYQGGIVAGEGGPAGAIPATFTLSPAHPNPFAQSTTLSLDFTEAGRVTVDVLDVLGRRVAVLYGGPVAAGARTLRFAADHLPGGTYVVRAVALGSQQLRVVTLAR